MNESAAERRAEERQKKLDQALLEALATPAVPAALAAPVAVQAPTLQRTPQLMTILITCSKGTTTSWLFDFTGQDQKRKIAQVKRTIKSVCKLGWLGRVTISEALKDQLR